MYFRLPGLDIKSVMDLTSGGSPSTSSSEDVASELDNSDAMQLVRQAVLFENIELLADLFKVNPWVWNRVDRHGRTPLMLAAHNGKLNSLRTILLLSPKSLNLVNERGKTALHMASESGETGIVLELVEIGSDPMKSDKEGHCALELAQMAGHNEVAARLIDAIQKESEDVNEAHIMLISACISGSSEAVNDILSKNMDKKQNREVIFNGRNEEDDTALLIACTNGHIEIVRHLLQFEEHLLQNHITKDTR
uniref:ANK_REP_REGION domain-containing protein n=2 Tax=Caenorhabditis tropicalis TaxID=1561998 RepID=A0A1I7UF80_9PELO